MDDCNLFSVPTKERPLKSNHTVIEEVPLQFRYLDVSIYSTVCSNLVSLRGSLIITGRHEEFLYEKL